MKKCFLVLTFFLFFINFSNSYSQLGGPYFIGFFPYVKSYQNTIYIIYSTSGFFKSSDNGLSWRQIDRKPINFGYWPVFMNSSSFYVSDSIILLPTSNQNGGIITTDGGDNWHVVNNGMINKNVNSAEKIGNYCFLGGAQALYRSSNLGETWDSVSSGLPATYTIDFLYAKGNNLYASVSSYSTTVNSIFCSSNFGSNWIFIGPSNGTDGNYHFIYKDSSFIFTSYINILSNNYFYRTSNNGINWLTLSNGLNNLGISTTYKFSQYLFCGNFFSSTNGGIYRSVDYGLNWIQKNNGLPTSTKYVKNIDGTNNMLFASVTNSALNFAIYKSSDFGELWTPSDSAIKNIKFTSFAENGDSIFASTMGFGIHLMNYPGVYIFSPVNRNNLDLNVRTLLLDNSILYAGCDTGGIFKTTNNGNNWINLSIGLPNHSIRTLNKYSNYFYVGTSESGIFRTSDFITWTPFNNGLTNLNIRSFHTDSNNLYVGTDSGLFKSTNQGLNWIVINNGLNNLSINSIKISGSFLLAGTNSGLYRSSNNGVIWQQVSPGIPNVKINSILTNEAVVVIATDSDSNGLYYSRDYTWTCYRAGNYPPIKAVGKAGSSVYAGTGNSTIYRITDPIHIEIKNNISEIPKKSTLYQNYPNPFNPKTTIKFSIVKNELVTLKIFDILGRELNTLVNAKLNSGNYSADWDGTEYSSGIYFYSINAGDFTQVKRMVLLK